MTTFALVLWAILGLSLVLHLATVAAAAFVMRRGKADSAIDGTPGITVLRPVCGIENHIEDTLRSTFEFTYVGPVELLFCVQSADDPICPIVQSLIAEYPHVEAKLLVGNDVISGNPKLNNLVKGWNAAKYDYILMSDSNVLLPKDYLERLIGRWTAGTGLVTSPPVGIKPENFWARFECAWLNTYQDRWQLGSEAVGNGFAQGKMLFWRRDVVEENGGLAVLGKEMAEDIASTKLVRGAGLKVRLLNEPLPQPIGERRFSDVWKRQVRWAKVRRLGVPLYFFAEVLTGALIPTIAMLMLGGDMIGLIPAMLVLWYSAEWVLARIGGWPATAMDIGAWILRDLSLPVLWLSAWFGRGFEWRGNAMHAADVTEK